MLSRDFGAVELGLRNSFLSFSGVSREILDHKAMEELGLGSSFLTFSGVSREILDLGANLRPTS